MIKTPLELSQMPEDEKKEIISALESIHELLIAHRENIINSSLPTEDSVNILREPLNLINIHERVIKFTERYFWSDKKKEGHVLKKQPSSDSLTPSITSLDLLDKDREFYDEMKEATKLGLNALASKFEFGEEDEEEVFEGTAGEPEKESSEVDEDEGTSSLNKEINRLNDDLEKNLGYLTDYETEIKDLQARVEELEKELSVTSGKVAELDKKLKLYENDYLPVARQEVEEIYKVNEELENKKRELEIKVDGLILEKEYYEKSYNDLLSTKQGEKNKKITELQKEIRELAVEKEGEIGILHWGYQNQLKKLQDELNEVNMVSEELRGWLKNYLEEVEERNRETKKDMMVESPRAISRSSSQIFDEHHPLHSRSRSGSQSVGNLKILGNELQRAFQIDNIYRNKDAGSFVSINSLNSSSSRNPSPTKENFNPSPFAGRNRGFSVGSSGTPLVSRVGLQANKRLSVNLLENNPQISTENLVQGGRKKSNDKETNNLGEKSKEISDLEKRIEELNDSLFNEREQKKAVISTREKAISDLEKITEISRVCVTKLNTLNQNIENCLSKDAFYLDKDIGKSILRIESNVHLLIAKKQALDELVNESTTGSSFTPERSFSSSSSSAQGGRGVSVVKDFLLSKISNSFGGTSEGLKSPPSYGERNSSEYFINGSSEQEIKDAKAEVEIRENNYRNVLRLVGVIDGDNSDSDKTKKLLENLQEELSKIGVSSLSEVIRQLDNAKREIANLTKELELHPKITVTEWENITAQIETLGELNAKYESLLADYNKLGEEKERLEEILSLTALKGSLADNDIKEAVNSVIPNTIADTDTWQDYLQAATNDNLTHCRNTIITAIDVLKTQAQDDLNDVRQRLNEVTVRVNNYETGLKNTLGVNTTTPLPDTWLEQITKQEDLTNANHQLDKLKEKTCLLEKELEDQKQKNLESQRLNAELAAQVPQLQVTISDLKKNIKDKEVQLGDLTNKIIEEIKTKEAHLSDYNCAKDSIGDLEKKLNELEEEAKNLLSDKQNVEKNWKSEKKSWETKILHSKQLISEQQEKLKKLVEEKATHEKTANELKSSQNEVISLKEQLAELTKVKEQLNSEYATVKEKLATLITEHQQTLTELAAKKDFVNPHDFKDYIAPNKLQAAAKNAGWQYTEDQLNEAINNAKKGLFTQNELDNERSKAIKVIEDKLTKELSEVQTNLEKVTEELKNAENTSKERQEQLNDLNAEKEELVKKYHQDLAEINKQLENASTQLKEKELLIKEQDNAIQTLQTELIAKVAELQVIEEQLQQLTDQKIQLETAHDITQKQHTKALETANKATEKAQTDLKISQGQLSVTQASEKQLNAKLVELEKDLATTKETADKMHVAALKEKNLLEEKLNDLQQELQDLQKELATKDKLIGPSELAKTIADKEAIEKDFNDLKTNLQNQIANLQQQLKDRENFVDPDKLAAVQQELQKLKDHDLTNLTKQVNNLQSDKATIKKELTHLKSHNYPTQLTDLQNKVNDLENELTAKSEDIANNYVGKPEHDAELQAANAALKKVEQQRDALLTSDQLKAVQEQLDQVNAKLTQQEQTAANVLRDMTAQRDTLNDKLIQANAAKDQAKLAQTTAGRERNTMKGERDVARNEKKIAVANLTKEQTEHVITKDKLATAKLGLATVQQALITEQADHNITQNQLATAQATLAAKANFVDPHHYNPTTHLFSQAQVNTAINDATINNTREIINDLISQLELENELDKNNSSLAEVITMVQQLLRKPANDHGWTPSDIRTSDLNTIRNSLNIRVNNTMVHQMQQAASYHDLATVRNQLIKQNITNHQQGKTILLLLLILTLLPIGGLLWKVRNLKKLTLKKLNPRGPKNLGKNNKK